jgi:NAD(P)-dependent dehydrogenase (short-subunit alcohol dehydrogenase family)
LWITADEVELTGLTGSRPDNLTRTTMSARRQQEDYMRIADSVAIVTGGASGLGGATARALAERGARVFALDLPGAVEKAAADAVPGISYLAADVTDPDQVRAAVDTAAEDGPLRIVVNCAGIGTAGRILSKKGVHDLDAYRKVIEINLIGTFNVLRLGADAISKTDPVDGEQRGVIINTASIAAFDGQIGQAAYASSKGGVIGLTLPAARDLAQFGIRVMTIAPGIVDTPMLAGVSDEFRAGLAAGVPFPKRLAQPAEYAQLAVMIVEHDYLNGEVIRMDGALRMAPR